MARYQKQVAVTILMLTFSIVFVRNTRSDFPLIFEKNLHAHDESSNSVVAANITRKFFPPMVRVNPFVEEQGNWMEGPYWQHIPPMFAYVPYIFFEIDGQVTIEVKRLAFAFVTLLTGLLFIFVVYNYKKSLLAAGAATISAILWVNTPFTHELITGYAFGVSDIVLAFTVVASFGAILWYLKNRKSVSSYQLIVISLVVALVVYYLPLFLVSPEAFKNGLLVTFSHFNQLEGWERPWHWHFTNYLPQRYLFGWTWIFFVGLAVAAVSWYRTRRTTLTLAGGWFLWNLIAISLVTSKVPNFIYQSYLLSWYFIVYGLFLTISTGAKRSGEIALQSLKERFLRHTTVGMVTVGVLILAILAVGYESVRFTQQFNEYRAQAYNYDSENEKFYQAAEQFQRMGLNQSDLVIVRVSDNDCWFRYPILFLTGAESKTLLEIYFHTVKYESILHKYKRMYFVFNQQEGLPKVGEYSYIDFDLNKLSADEVNQVIQAFIDIHKQALEQDILRIKKDKTSCQWLVPDHILNAP